MKKLEENRIVQRAMHGDLEAFEVLVKRHQSSMIALAFNILGDKDDACDVVQEAFVRAYANLERFDLERNFKTWILSITSKRCIDRIRKNRSFLKYFLHETRNKENFAPNPGYKLEDSHIFSPLLRILKPKERLAIGLKINEDYTALEIAQVLGCSESTARVHLFNARKKLRKALTAPGSPKILNPNEVSSEV